jgi:hypothetical protein
VRPPNKKKTGQKVKKKAALFEEDDHDLFELIGTYKDSEKKNFDYEEIIDQIDNVSKALTDERIEELKRDEDAKPCSNYQYAK